MTTERAVTIYTVSIKACNVPYELIYVLSRTIDLLLVTCEEAYCFHSSLREVRKNLVIVMCDDVYLFETRASLALSERDAATVGTSVNDAVWISSCS